MTAFTVPAARAGLLALAVLAAPAQANEVLRFQVLLDDEPIGEHRFRISSDAAATSVDSRASFDVKFLFVNAYRYRHNSQELFRDGCLQEINATTDDNGKRYRVAGAAGTGGFDIQRGDGRERASGCLMTFAYWDPAFLEQSRLLNPQTGAIESVRVRRAGSERVEVGGQSVAATRYALTTTGEDGPLTIDLWYNDSLGWVGLASDAGKGRRIVYRRL